MAVGGGGGGLLRLWQGLVVAWRSLNALARRALIMAWERGGVGWDGLRSEGRSLNAFGRSPLFSGLLGGWCCVEAGEGGCDVSLGFVGGGFGLRSGAAGRVSFCGFWGGFCFVLVCPPAPRSLRSRVKG